MTEEEPFELKNFDINNNNNIKLNDNIFNQNTHMIFFYRKKLQRRQKKKV